MAQEVPSSVPSSATSHSIPQDAQSRFKSIQDLNALDTSGAHAWHLKLSYDHFDSDGDNDFSGTYEEWFAGPKKFERIYTSSNFQRTEVATEHGLFVVGSQKWPGPIDLQVQREVVNPTSLATADASRSKLETIDWQVGNAALPCVVVRRTDITISDNGLIKYCTDRDAAVLRYSRGKGWFETVYNKILSFQGRSVAQEVTVTDGRKPYLKILVVALQDLQPDEGVFAPSLEAELQNEPVEVISSELDVIKRPGDEWLGGEKGKATVELVIAKDGRVKSAKGIDGPSRLMKLSAESARKMQFRPFLVMGEPVEVATHWGFSK